jgi:hypothetical protein
MFKDKYVDFPYSNPLFLITFLAWILIKILRPKARAIENTSQTAKKRILAQQRTKKRQRRHNGAKK